MILRIWFHLLVASRRENIARTAEYAVGDRCWTTCYPFVLSCRRCDTARKIFAHNEATRHVVTKDVRPQRSPFHRDKDPACERTEYREPLPANWHMDFLVKSRWGEGGQLPVQLNELDIVVFERFAAFNVLLRTNLT